MRRTRASVLGALALVAGVSGCGEGSERDAGRSPSAAPPASAAITPSPEASEPPFVPAARPADGGPASGNGLGLVDVRVASRPGYDRVVFELGGTGRPGWYAAYTDDPVQDGSGDPVELEGTAYLMIVLRGMALPLDTDLPPYGDVATRVPGTGTEGIAEIAPGGVFEGDQLAYVGLTGTARPFRVFTLDDPARVVVDVRQ